MTRSQFSISRRELLATASGLGVSLARPSWITVRAAAANPIDGIPALIAPSEAINGIVVIDPSDKVLFQRNTWAPFVSASLYKLILISETLRRVEAGELLLTDQILLEPWYFVEANGEDAFYAQYQIGSTAPLEEMIYAAGAWSSNVAAIGLLSLTTIDRLNEFCDELGMPGTHFWTLETEIPEIYTGEEGTLGNEDLARAIAFSQAFASGSYINLTTPGDMAWFLRLLRDDSLISNITSWRLKQVLSSRAITDRLPARLPPSVNVTHKTGNLTGVLHDVGIISNGTSSSIVVAMAQAVTDLDLTFFIEQQLGLIGYELLEPVEPSATPIASPQA